VGFLAGEKLIRGLKGVAKRFSHAMPEAHLGVLPHLGRLLAFGNRGLDSGHLRSFRQWSSSCSLTTPR
jgi:hypothetical protein